MNNEPKSDILVLDDLEIGYSRTGKKLSVFGPVNISVSRCEMIGVIGRNGIGKSTLLRTIASLQPPLKGDIFIKGHPAKDLGLKEIARIVSYVSTEAVYGFQIKVTELVSMGRFPYTGWMGRLNDSDRRAISQAVELTGISNLLNKPVQELSDGERQKVMIARALAQDTPLIILDEPTAFLDLPARYEILRILQSLTVNQNKTIIFSTHDLNIAMDVTDRIWLMTENELMAGAPEDLLINNVFRKLFLNSRVEFDPASFSFRFNREYRKVVSVKGNRELITPTCRAMERIGFKTDGKISDMEIEVDEINGKPRWHLQDKDDVLFDTIYDLVVYLKNLYNRA